MDKKEIQLRKKRHKKAVEFLESFLINIQDNGDSDYNVYTYSELLIEVRAKAMIELNRIARKA